MATDFTNDDHAMLAFLLYKRVNRDFGLAFKQWQSVVGVNRPYIHFSDLLEEGEREYGRWQHDMLVANPE